MSLDPRWFLAQHLEELRAGEPSSSDFDFELGQRRLGRWKASPAFSDPEVFAHFLDAQKMKEEELLRWLSWKPQAFGDSHWAKEILLSLEDSSERDAVLKKVLGAGDPTAGFLFLIWPLVHSCKQKLLARLAALSRPPFEIEGAANLLLEALIPHLRRQLHRTLILEINIARMEGRLTGETPEQRFQSFLQGLQQPETRRTLLSEYPVLARRLHEGLENWQEASFEFLQRLTADFSQLEKSFGPLGTLQSLHGNLGDAHRHGRSVIAAEFSAGIKVVYKPRSLTLDQKFQDFVGWMQTQQATLDLKTYKILDRGNYGWCEFVVFKGCGSEDEIERFYERQGVWLALFYILGGTDLHLENVIASGEYPINIDLETLFHPHFLPAEASQSDELAMETLSDSVLSIGLLPSPVHMDDGQIMDKSGLGASENQTLNFQVDGVTNSNSDEIRIVKVPGRIGEVHSSPVLNGKAIEPQLYRAFVKKGFAEAYAFFQARRAEIEGHLESFKNIPTRIVLRPSSTYGLLLAEGLHPKMNRNSLERELLFNQLWSETKRTPLYKSIVTSEVRQLMEGDIPYFMSTTDSLDLSDTNGHRFEKFLFRSGWQIARDRLRRLGHEDLKTQLWLLDATYASTAKVSREGMRWGESTKAVSSERVKTFLDAAIAAGEQLKSSAVVHPNGSVSWVSLRFKLESQAADAGHYNLGLVEDDLYSGLSGVIFFLAYLGSITADPECTRLARGGLQMLERRIASTPSYPQMGAFTGLAGFIYLYVHLAEIWQDAELLRQAERLLPALENLIGEDKDLDFIGGAAGCIPPLLSLWKHSGSMQALALAKKCGELLLSSSTVEKERRLFPNLVMPRGFSHGHSGVAFALSELAHATGQDNFLQAALQTARHERDLLGDAHWTDIPERPQAATWCHGAPGIALARVAMEKRFPHEEEISADAERAVQATLNAPLLENQILCHGSLGNLETLLCAGARHGVLPSVISTKAQAILQEVRQRGWVSPLPPEVMEVGLMKGLAGIGYGFLRLAAEKQVPCVLMLEGPRP